MPHLLHWISRGTLSKRAVATAALALLAGVAGSTIAFTLGTAPPERISVFQAEVQDSNFAIDDLDASLLGLAAAEVDLTLVNLDSASAHAATVTVQILDGDGAVLDDATSTTGTVEAGSTWTQSFHFASAGLAKDYETTLVIVDDFS